MPPNKGEMIPWRQETREGPHMPTLNHPSGLCAFARRSTVTFYRVVIPEMIRYTLVFYQIIQITMAKYRHLKNKMTVTVVNLCSLHRSLDSENKNVYNVLHVCEGQSPFNRWNITLWEMDSQGFPG